MAGLNFLPASLASSSRCLLQSSRNFRNMIQVSIGRRSRSPFSPLSLRMMSRADLMRLPSVGRWSSVRLCLALLFLLCCLRPRRAVLASRRRLAEASPGRQDSRDLDRCRGEIGGTLGCPGSGTERPVLGIFVEQFVENLTASGANLSKKCLRSGLSRLRPLAAGAKRRIEGKMAEQVERIGVGLACLLRPAAQIDAPLLKGGDDLARFSGSPHFGGGRRKRKQCADLSAVYSVILHDAQLLPSASRS